MKVSVIIPTRNRRRTLLRVVRSLLGQDYPADLLELIVVDDNSTDGTKSAIAALSERVIYLASGQPAHTYNYHHNLNLGLEQATGELLLLLDSDMVICRRAISELVATYQEWADRGESVAVRGWWKQASGFPYSRRRLLLERYDFQTDLGRIRKLKRFWEGRDNLDPVDCPGCFLLVPTASARSVGGFPAEHAAYGHDGIFQQKLKTEGNLRFVFNPMAYGLHKPLWGDETNRPHKAEGQQTEYYQQKKKQVPGS